MSKLIGMIQGLTPESLIFNSPSATVRGALEGRMQSLQGKCDRLMAKASKETRDMTEEETRLFDSYDHEFTDCEMELRALDADNPQTRRQTDPVQPSRQHASSSMPAMPSARASANETGGFRNFGELVLSASNAARGVNHDRRLIAASFSEESGVGGGFLVPSRYTDELMNDALALSGFLDSVTRLPMPSGNLSVAMMDGEDHSTGAVAGVELKWVAESSQLTDQTPTLRAVNFNARKGTIFCNVSNELLQDAPSADVQLRDIFSSALRLGLESAALTGNGVGRPTGILNSGCLISIAKEAAQPADTFSYANAINMLSRLHPQMLSGARWIANPSVLPQLLEMAFRIENAAGSDYVGGSQVPVLVSGGEYQLLGLPLRFSEALPALGDLGDIILAAPPEYLLAETGQMAIEVSPHHRFDFDEVSFRLRIRVDGSPRWSAPITPVNGDTLSPFVALAERA